MVGIPYQIIQKIYKVDPLICPKYQGQMKIIYIIDDFEIIDKILNHLTFGVSAAMIRLR